MTDKEYAFQINIKKNEIGSLYNLVGYEHTDEEYDRVLRTFTNNYLKIEAVENIINAKSVLKESLSATPVEQPRTQSASADGAKACKHGEMTFRTGKSAKGPWKGYFCPSPKGTADQCEPQFIR